MDLKNTLKIKSFEVLMLWVGSVAIGYEKDTVNSWYF